MIYGMPHSRPRFLDPWIKKFIRSSSAIGLIGMRQTGKTTLLAGSAKTIVRFDREANVAQFQRESEALLNEGPFPILLDEVQKYPAAFDEIKARVDERKTPGRFLMTGSVRFNSKREIRESMTGRIVILELLPMGLAEAHHRPLAEAIPRIISGMAHAEKTLEALHRANWVSLPILRQHLEAGGLPGICFNRDLIVRQEMMDNHLDTLLGRDLRQVYQSKLPVARLRELLRLLAAESGLPLNKSRLARQLSTTVPTLGAHLEALEALFLIRPLGKGYYLEDLGLATHLGRFDHSSVLTDLRRQVFAELQQQIHYRFRSTAQLSTYVSTSGAQIPFVLSFEDRSRLAILVDEGDRPSNGNLKMATWFLKKHGDRAKCLILHTGKEGAVIGPRVLAMPHNWLYG
jgi:predicted AAA+ superfamily ATPase